VCVCVCVLLRAHWNFQHLLDRLVVDRRVKRPVVKRPDRRVKRPVSSSLSNLEATDPTAVPFIVRSLGEIYLSTTHVLHASWVCVQSHRHPF